MIEEFAKPGVPPPSAATVGDGTPTLPERRGLATASGHKDQGVDGAAAKPAAAKPAAKAEPRPQLSPEEQRKMMDDPKLNALLSALPGSKVTAINP